jgi:hypothetical protein
LQKFVLFYEILSFVNSKIFDYSADDDHFFGAQNENASIDGRKHFDF